MITKNNDIISQINNLYEKIKQLYNDYQKIHRSNSIQINNIISKSSNSAINNNFNKEKSNLTFFKLNRSEWKLMVNVFLGQKANGNNNKYCKKDILKYLKASDENIDEYITNKNILQYLKVNSNNIDEYITNTVVKSSENINILINFYNKLINCILNLNKLNEMYFTNSFLHQVEKNMINIYELYSQVFIPILFSRIILSHLSSFSENYLDLANKINNYNYKQILNNYNEEYKNYIEILQNTLTNSYFFVKRLGALVLGSYGILEYSDNLKEYLKIKNSVID